MSAQYPQVFEGQLDSILSGAVTEPSSLQTMLRTLLVTRRRYQCGTPIRWDQQLMRYVRVSDVSIVSREDCIGGALFSTYWSWASQKARIESGIAFLMPIVGTAVGDYPPKLPPDGNGLVFDTMGNFIGVGGASLNP